jgi:hypothetical protein
MTNRHDSQVVIASHSSGNNAVPDYPQTINEEVIVRG